MNRSTFLTLALAASLHGFSPRAASAQTDTIPTEMRVHRLPSQQLSGPRFGFTTFTGEVARYRSHMGKSSIMSQIGWQFETQMVSTTNGHQALIEWVLLVGGLEQNEFNTSIAGLAGYRLPNGFEFGVGPNVTATKDSEELTTSLVIAGGATMRAGELYLPINAALAFGTGGPRLTTLIGWIVG